MQGRKDPRTWVSSVDLELGPVASVTEEMRKAVARAFRDAGLDFNWTTPPGGWANGSAASPTLRIFLQSDASSSSLGVVDAIRPQLAGLMQIRAGLPALPLGFLTVTSSAKRWYAFRPTDTCAEIEAAMATIEKTNELDSATVGWLSDENRWIRLEEKIWVVFSGGTNTELTQ